MTKREVRSLVFSRRAPDNPSKWTYECRIGEIHFYKKAHLTNAWVVDGNFTKSLGPCHSRTMFSDAAHKYMAEKSVLEGLLIGGVSYDTSKGIVNAKGEVILKVPRSLKGSKTKKGPNLFRDSVGMYVADLLNNSI